MCTLYVYIHTQLYLITLAYAEYHNHTLFYIYICTMQQLPHSNAVWNGDNLYLLPSVNIAMRLLSGGKLVSTPVISGADRMSIERIVSVLEAARDGTYGSKGGQEEAAFM